MHLDPLEAYHFDLDGYVVLKQAVDPVRIRSLTASLQQIEAAQTAGAASPAVVSWTPVIHEMRVLNLPECGQEFVDLIDHPAILARVRALVPGPQRLVEGFSITRGQGVGLPLHSIETARYRVEHGRPRCDMVTAVVNLTDCGPEDGPLVLFAGSHKLGVPFPYSPVHPAWQQPPHDRADAAASLAAIPAATRHIAWEDIPGYREITVEAGDVVVFVQSLWHGAKQLRSGKVRRTLYHSYSPYHFSNWHGIVWSEALRERCTAEQRELLSGPFLGNRYPGVSAEGVPRDRFAMVRDSELGARRIVPAVVDGDSGSLSAEARAAAARTRLREVMERKGAASGSAPVAGIAGSCVIDLCDAGLAECTWTIAVGRDGAFVVNPGRGERPDAVLTVGAEDLAAVLLSRRDPAELFHHGRLRILGDYALAMQVASQLST